MIIQGLQKVFDENNDKDLLYVRNLLKEFLQNYILNYVYNSEYGDELIFTGGTCLRFCYGLPRLSEDLDFNSTIKNFDYPKFKNDIKKYFATKLDFENLEDQIKGKNKIIYLKFPVLDQIGYPVEKPTDNLLFVRIDITPIKTKNFQTEIFLKSSYDFSFLIKHYNLEDLFAGKLCAILQRKTRNGEKVKPRFKGRDYFDVFWLIDKGAKPNLKRLLEITKYKTKKEVKKELTKKIKQAIKKKNHLKNDLYPFFENKKFVDQFIENIDFLEEKINKII